MDEGKQVIRISVRNLVEFILREGDIDERSAGADKDAMQMGAKLHRKIQKRMGSNYQAEVPLKWKTEYDDFILMTEGRADGILTDDKGVCVDEIKGVFMDVESMEEPVPVHLAQAKCYAYMYLELHDLKTIGVSMTYCQMETEEIKRFYFWYEKEEIEAWFMGVIEAYKKWAKFQVDFKKIRNSTIEGLPFPYEYREGQKDLAVSVYRSILRKKKLFIQAPTGVGKTMATVYPAVQALAKGLGERIFYLTAKTITRTVAEHAFDILREGGLRCKSITLTAKEKICFCEDMKCDPHHCPYAKGHFDRVNDAVFDLLKHNDSMTREVIEEQARKFKVCPFEMSLDLSTWVDVVICDYNYVFDPNVHLRRFFGEGVKSEALLLVDEAHNLVERGRSMYSASLCKEEVMKVRKLVKEKDGKLASSLGDLNKLLLELKRECDGIEVLSGATNIYLKLLTVLARMEQFFETYKNESVEDEVRQLFFDIRSFLTTYEKLDEHYVIYDELTKDGRFVLNLFCVNPAVNLQDYLEKCNSTVFFSATLLPINYYKNLLSTKADDYAIYAKSSFDKGKRFLGIAGDVNTRYTCRGETMYQRYAWYLKQTALLKQGNYMAFFPSYQFMEAVYDEFVVLTENDGIDSIIQGFGMSEEAREIFLEEFEDHKEGSLVGFCIMGGIFSEGIDLTGERLIGAMIVGTGLPMVCTEREILKDYFNAKGLKGFDYAYVYPGMNKVMQSAGRVIRTEEDEGVILLLDERFVKREYQETFPREWEGFERINMNNLQEKLYGFWEDRSSKESMNARAAVEIAF